jgi:hypothetical protein
MANLLSFFKTQEHSRFRAFKRAAFSTSAIQEWLAACLANQYSLPVTSSNNSNSNSSSNSIRGAMNSAQFLSPPISQPQATSRRLEDWVVPGQADLIGATAATLAKVYAQRLVKAAIELRQQKDEEVNRQQQEQQQQQKDDDSDSKPPPTPRDPHRPLSPTWIRQAHEERTRQGLDPGFFLQDPASTSLRYCNPLSTTFAQKEFEQRRLAALAAQEAYMASNEANQANQADMDVS